MRLVILGRYKAKFKDCFLFLFFHKDGANVCAFHCLAKRFNYTMLYCNGINCFWLRNDILFPLLKIEINIIQKVLNPTFLYKFVHLNYAKSNKKWHQVTC